MKSVVCLGTCIWFSKAARGLLGAGRAGEKLQRWVCGTQPVGLQIGEGTRTSDTEVLGAFTVAKGA